VGLREFPTGSASTTFFMGGWDPHEVQRADDPVGPLGGLAWVYPDKLKPEVLERLPSVDFTKDSFRG
jgi:hypothetical protein